MKLILLSLPVLLLVSACQTNAPSQPAAIAEVSPKIGTMPERIH